ncbi:hypothetical protein NHQ30_003006 [Ciborinia camelliae]|nr:hypothetical protein NHQ30_003006 [Ciborinia camelliae]
MPTRRKIAVLGVLLVGTLAIACSFARMVLWGEILGPKRVVSLLMFWSMLEVGIAMIASCLPTLRPLFHGFSPESVIRSIRSALSLHSLSSRNKSFPGATKGPFERSESETAINGGSPNLAPGAKRNNWNPLATGDTIDVEAYAMGRIGGNVPEPDKITRETEITQTYQKA